MIHNFELGGEKVRLWQNKGESFEHILMKALAYTMFIGDYPKLEIEVKVGLKYKPDLVVQKGKREFDFWGECGQNSTQKTAWLLKHTSIAKFVLFKLGFNTKALMRELRKEIPKKYRSDDRLVLINFDKNVKNLTTDKVIEEVQNDWFNEYII